MSNDTHDTNIVVVGLVVQDGRLSIAKRAATKQEFPDRFELPGGHVDPGEQLEVALARELREELGIQVVVQQPFHAFTYTVQGIFKVEVCYLCEMAPGSPPPQPNPADHSEIAWISESEIDRMVKDDEETAAVRKAFRMLKGEI